ncbi:MAG: xanthine dehydrogenase accessory factor [Solirubrobacteraceae bacterium]|jgi:xanthine dehydrogenase accessory factor|nr:xanthine dehydrogenase accessory factor [Solirubrobacteraceae bacterium]
MMKSVMTRRASELAAQRAPFVTATVVRTQRPTSARPGDVALVLDDGTIEGFVGGVCAQHSVRVYALKTIENGDPVLLRILPDGSGEELAGDEDQISAGEEVSNEEGTVTVKNTCLSGGAIEVFLEPVVPAPRVLVVGDAPIAGAIHRIGEELGLEIVTVEKNGPEPSADDLAVVVAGHGRDEYDAIRRGLEAGVPYVGLVASHKRGKAVLDDLREDGVPAGLLELVDIPAGINIGARSPGEIAVSILAKIVSVRREERIDVPRPVGGLAVHHAGGRAHEKAPARAKSAPPARAKSATSSAAPIIAVDPICGMTVAAVPGTPSVEHDGETIYFCCDGCKAKYEAQHQHATAAG